jgi:hypothetical protein
MDCRICSETSLTAAGEWARNNLLVLSFSTYRKIKKSRPSRDVFEKISMKAGLIGVSLGPYAPRIVLAEVAIMRPFTIFESFVAFGNVVSVIQAVVWPPVIVVLVFIYRREIPKLIQAITGRTAIAPAHAGSQPFFSSTSSSPWHLVKPGCQRNRR